MVLNLSLQLSIEDADRWTTSERFGAVFHQYAPDMWQYFGIPDEEVNAWPNWDEASSPSMGPSPSTRRRRRRE